MKYKAYGHAASLEVSEVKMLRFFFRVTRMVRIRNRYTRGTADVRCLESKSERPD